MNSHKMSVPCYRVPQGTSTHLRSLLLGLLKKDPRERMSHGVLCVCTCVVCVCCMCVCVCVCVCVHGGGGAGSVLTFHGCMKKWQNRNGSSVKDYWVEGGCICSFDFLPDAKYLSAVAITDILSEAAWSHT